MSATSYQFTITGRTPLLMHADNVEWADYLEQWRKSPENKKLSKPGDDRTPGFTWLGGLYHKSGQAVLPADNLAVALRQAGARLLMKGNKTFKEESVSGMSIVEDSLPVLVGGKPVDVTAVLEMTGVVEFDRHLKATKKAGFELFVRRAAVGTSKHIRVRPLFREWAVRGTVSVTSSAISSQVLQQLFELAGAVGVGSWRPGGKTPGRYGMFEGSVKPAK